MWVRVVRRSSSPGLPILAEDDRAGTQATATLRLAACARHLYTGNIIVATAAVPPGVGAMNESAVEDTRGRAAEAAQVMLALAGLYLLLAIADLAAHEGLTAEAQSATAGPLACVMPGPLSERVVGGEPAPPELVPSLDPAAEAPRGGELQAALAQAQTRVGELTAGIRHQDVSYAAVDGLADLIGAELHQTSSASPARLISAEGLVEIVPFSATAHRNLRPITLPASTVVD